MRVDLHDIDGQGSVEDLGITSAAVDSGGGGRRGWVGGGGGEVSSDNTVISVVTYEQGR